MRKLLRILLATFPLCSLAVPGMGRAGGEVTFTKLLDSETPLPGEDDTFGPIAGMQDDDPLLAMDRDGNLAFAAGGRVFAIVDGRLDHTPAPGGEDLTQVAIEGRRVAFAVLDDGGARGGGIFRWEPGTEPIEVAGAHTLVPGGEGCVFWTGEDGVSWWRFSMDGDAILFSGRGSSEPGTDCDELKGTFLWRNEPEPGLLASILVGNRPVRRHRIEFSGKSPLSRVSRARLGEGHR